MPVKNISGAAILAIQSRREITLRTIIKNNIIDRVISPIQTIKKENGYDIVYSQTKKTYTYEDSLDGMTIDRLDPNKMTLIAVKGMNVTSTIDNNVEYVIFTLEQSGYIII